MVYNPEQYARLRNTILGISAIAWLAILLKSGASRCCAAVDAGASLLGLVTPEQACSLASGWALMLVAMMSPMLIHSLYHIWISSFNSRRLRSCLLFAVSYAGVWMVAGVALTLAELVARKLAPGSYVPAISLGIIALVWQASPFKQRCLNRCHNLQSIAAFGAAADWGAVRAGIEHARWCTASCWATMLLPMLLPQGHNLAMMAVSVLMFCERLEHPHVPAWRMRGFGAALRCFELLLLGPRTTEPAFAIGAHSRT